MTFTVPTALFSLNVSETVGSGTFTAGQPSVTVPAGTEILVATFSNVATSSVTSITDGSSNTYKLAGTTGSGTTRRVDVFRGLVNTQLTASVTNVTVHYTAGATTVYNVIGVALPGSITGEPFQGTFQSSAGLTASQAVTSLLSNYEYLIAFCAEAGATPAWTAPAVALSTVSGGSTFFTASYTPANDAGGTPATTWSTTNSSWTMVAVGSYQYETDKYLDAYTSQYGQFTGTRWPASGALLVTCELLLNGTWTDVTPFVYQRDGSVHVAITSGRQDESGKLTTAQMQLQLNNRSGTFSPRNAASPFYPYIGRNTQIRFSVPAGTNLDDAGSVIIFTGEVSSWPPSWDVTGSDVWTSVTASGITRRLNQNASIGSSLRRFYLRKAVTDPTYPVAFWPCDDAAGSTQLAEMTGNGSAMTFTGSPTLASDTSFGGAGALPVLNSSIWTGLTNSMTPPGDVLYTVPGTYSFTPPAGTTTVDAICVGGGGGGGSAAASATQVGAGGGGGEYAEDAAVAVTAGTSYTVIVGAGGTGGTASSNNGANGGLSSFHGDSVTVTAHGGGYGSHGHAGAKGTGSANSVHHDGGAGFYDATNAVAGGGGSSGGQAAGGNSATNATGAAAPDTYAGVGGDGGGTVAGGGGGGTVNFVRSYTATHSYAYQGSDAGNRLIHTDVTMQQGGDIADTVNGKSKTFILFDHATIASDLSGATITKVTLRLANNHTWFFSGGTVSLGWDTTTSFPSTKADPSAHVSLKEYSMAENATTTQDIGTQFGTAFKSSSAACLVLFKNSNSLTYYMKFNGPAQSSPPVMTIYYSK